MVAKYSYKVKSGKKTVTKTLTRKFALTVEQGALGGIAKLVDVGVADVSSATTVNAWQNLWGSTYKALGKQLFYTSKKNPYKVFTVNGDSELGVGIGLRTGDTLSLKVTTAGAVTATLTYDTGKKDKKTKKAVYYKPTCSTVVIPTSAVDADPFTGEAPLYFAPSAANNFPGFAASAPL